MISRVEQEDDRSRLLALIPANGATIGNTKLMQKLGWPPDKYWPVRDALIEEDKIERARGKGGSVRRVLAPVIESGIANAPVELETAAAKAAIAYEKEKELYEPIRSVLAREWARDRLSSPLSVEITAQQGRRQTGGRWSRPDIASVEVKTFRYVPGKYLELTTFEVKPQDVIDVSSVYEALAHRRNGTRSYLLLHVPDPHAGEDVIDELCSVARSHGVGVIVAADPGKYETWDEREEAQRHEPDPERLDQFIATQLSELTQNKIALALR